jgi:hypothetical protein
LLPLLGWTIWRLARLRAILSVGAALASLLLCYELSPSIQVALTRNQLVSRWTARLTDPASAAHSVGLRAEIARSVISGMSEPTPLLAGHGMLTESHVSTAIYADLGTVDNTYLNLFYEVGIVGLSIYLWAFIAPLWRLRHLAAQNPHYWSVVSLMTGSIAFVSYHYYTFNFLVAASMATLFSAAREAKPGHRLTGARGRSAPEGGDGGSGVGLAEVADTR